MKKLNAVMFAPNSPGGVVNVLGSILKHTDHKIDYRLVLHHNINSKTNSYGKPSEGAYKIFDYDPSHNIYHTVIRLSKELSGSNDLIIANDWLELSMISLLGLKNPSVFILHGDYDYYYETAVRNVDSIDTFITVSKSIYVRLKNLLPHRVDDIHHLKLPVADVPFKKNKSKSDILRIVFVGRATEDKGYFDLPLIDRLLRVKGISAKWNIYGFVSDINTTNGIWDIDSDVRHHGSVTNQELVKVLNNYDIFILPSRAEGMPVSLIEAMKAGLVPLASRLSGIQELVSAQRGYLFDIGDINGYVSAISFINYNRNLLDSIGEKCRRFALSHFDSKSNVACFERIFISTVQRFPILSRKRVKRKIYGSRLDQFWLPNCVTTSLRKLLHK